MYVKGIFVKKIDAVCGYNMNMERENPVSGDIDMDKAKNQIAHMIENTDNREYMTRLAQAVRLAETTKEIDSIELQAGAWKLWSIQRPGVWLNIFKEVFMTEKICRVTNLDHAREAQYKGWTVLSQNIPFTKGFIKKDVEVVQLPKQETERRIGLDHLTSKGRANVRWARRIVEGAMDKKIRDLRIMDFIDEPSQQGEARRNTWIKISRDILDRREKVLEVMMHEMVHYVYGYRDLTHEFQEAQGRIAARVAMYLIKGGHKARSGGVPAKTQAEKEIEQAEIRKKLIDLYIDWEAGTGEGENRIREITWQHPYDIPAKAGAFGINTFGMKQHERINAIVDAVKKAALEQ